MHLSVGSSPRLGTAYQLYLGRFDWDPLGSFIQLNWEVVADASLLVIVIDASAEFSVRARRESAAARDIRAKRVF